MHNGRQYAVGVDGTKVIFECARAKHRYAVNFGSKRLPVSRRLSESSVRLHASWWSRDIERAEPVLIQQLGAARAAALLANRR